MGPRVSTATGHIARVAPAALAGKTVRVLGRPDLPHSFTDVRDMARALVRSPASRGLGPGLARADQRPGTQAEVSPTCAARSAASRGR